MEEIEGTFEEYKSKIEAFEEEEIFARDHISISETKT
jgi:hypothetical protein